MSKLRNAIEFAPEFIGLTGDNAKRWAFPLLAMFDADVAKATDVFDLKPGESIEDRFDPLNGLYMAKGARREKVAYFIGLMMLAALSCAVAKGKTEHEEARNRLAGVLSLQEQSNLDMASVYSVADASTQTTWL